MPELENEIFKHYEKHERTFDKGSIHGRMHAGRAVVFCEIMGRYLHLQGNSIDFALARRTTGLHDAGRENNGEDIWEKQSAQLLFEHLKLHGMEEKDALEKSKVIIKKEASKITLESVIFQSADCIDIMRSCTGRGGRLGFNKNFLSFLIESSPDSEDDKFRNALIEEAADFIYVTEYEKRSSKFKSSKGFMAELLKVIQNEPQRFQILSTLLPNS